MNEHPDKLKPALFGGIVIGVISALPFLQLLNCFCCSGILLGGFLSVFFYKSDLPPSIGLTSNDALQVGALAGVFGAVIEIMLSMAIFLALGNVVGEALVDVLESSGLADQLPPGTMDEIRQGIEEGPMTPFSIISSFIISPLFGLLGGLIGYAVFKTKPGQGLTVQGGSPMQM